jgi:hypothetical protein
VDQFSIDQILETKAKGTINKKLTVLYKLNFLTEMSLPESSTQRNVPVSAKQTQPSALYFSLTSPPDLVCSELLEQQRV